METRVYCLNPLVAVIDGCFSAETAAAIIEMGRDNLERASVVDRAGGSEIHDARTNSLAKVDQWADPLLTEIGTTISNLVHLPPENSEPAQILHYIGDQKYDAHNDSFDRSPGGMEMLARGGQRLFTSICYLNDVEEGGSTDFPKLKLSVKPKLGRILIFGNTRLGTAEGHPHSIHTGTSVTKGEKWAMTMWWRQLAYHVQRDYPETGGDFTVL